MQNMALVAQTCAGKITFWWFLGKKCSTFKTLKNHYNLAVQALGTWTNYFSCSKLAWSIYQSLFWLENDHDNCPQANPGRKFYFSKIALNRVLTLPNARSRREVSKFSGIIEIENKSISAVTKHWKYRISVPMSF